MYDLTGKQSQSPPYNPDNDTKRLASESENDADVHKSQYEPEFPTSPPKPTRYMSLADRSATFTRRKLGSIIAEYKHDLDLGIPVANEELK